MDDRRFDNLARRLAGGTSRRGLLAGLVGGALGLLGREGAAACRPAGRTCRVDDDCCSGLCDPNDPTRHRRCICPDGTENCRGECVDPETAFSDDQKNCGACGHRCPGAPCQRAICVQGVCGLEPNPASVGRPCDAGNKCTTNDVCQADGTCQGEPAIFCLDLEPCATSVCDPATGTCKTRVNKQNIGLPCNDLNRCTKGEVCQANGLCGGGRTATVCTPLDDCHDAGVCDPGTGACSNPAKADGTPCGGGVCCGGVCLDTSFQNDPHNCGACGHRCQWNETCVDGQCWCGNRPTRCDVKHGGNCCISELEGDFCPSAGGESGFYVDVASCGDTSICHSLYDAPGPGCPIFVATCPAGSTVCKATLPSGSVQACCPSGSTCDTTTGVCLH